MSDLSKKSEHIVLSFLIKNPSTIFDIDGLNIEASDFHSNINRHIYQVIKMMAEKPGSLELEKALDPVLVEDAIKNIYDVGYTNNSAKYNETINRLLNDKNYDKSSIKEHLNIITTESYKNKIKNELGKINESLGSMSNAAEMVETVEKQVYDFTSGLFVGTDVTHLGSKYIDFVSRIADKAKNGQIENGLKTGFNFYDEAIGGGLRRGTVNVIAARPKRHKSMVALTIANNISKQKIPVLYLDTELNEELQLSRLTAIETAVPLHSVENGLFIWDNTQSEKIKQFANDIGQRPFDYVRIAGWPLEKQISIIRRWFAKRVGRNKDGRWNNALVILDYLKLMNAKDKGADKEYEALGYRISALHDLMKDYDNPMLALAQQNRSGVEIEDATTISGSDRIIWLCDNFSILSKKSDQEIQQAVDHINQNPEYEDMFSNLKLNVVECRHGPGCQAGEFISLYVDFRDPRIASKHCTGIIKEIGLEKPNAASH